MYGLVLMECRFQFLSLQFDLRHPDVLRFNIKMIKQLMSNISYFIVCEATCFGLYVTIIRPSCESSQEGLMMVT